MTQEELIYQQPMQPWPTLLRYGKQIKLSNNHELYYFENGEHHQHHLLMLHGLGDEADTWRHVFLPLSEAYHTLAIDLPGFGRSEKPDVDYTPKFMMDVIIEYLDQLGIAKTIIMGSSLGGILAHGLAMSYPERVSGLVLVGGALIQTEPMGDWSLRLMQLPILGEWLYTQLRKDPDAAFASLNNVYHQLEGLPEPDRAFLYTRVNQRVWSDGQRRAYFSTLRKLSPWLKQIQKELPALLKHIEIPTFVIRGEYDQLFSGANADAITNRQPNAVQAVIKATSHLPQQEDPQGFIKIVMPWLKENF